MIEDRRFWAFCEGFGAHNLLYRQPSHGESRGSARVYAPIRKLRFRVSRFRVWGLGFGVWDLGFRHCGTLGDFWFMGHGLGFLAQGLGFRV